MKRARKPESTKPGWQLTTGDFLIHWRQGNKELYADKVRIAGCLFYAAVHGDIPERVPKKRSKS